MMRLADEPRTLRPPPKRRPWWRLVFAGRGRGRSLRRERAEGADVVDIGPYLERAREPNGAA